MSRLNLHDVRCEALFASRLQRCDNPSARDVADAIARSVRAHGSRGCAALMAQEFGEHPETAVARMRWVRGILAVPAPDSTRPRNPHTSRLAVITAPAGRASVQRAA
jgi:hypothetical protein